MFAPLRLLPLHVFLFFAVGGFLTTSGNLAAQPDALVRDREFDRGSGIALDCLEPIQIQNLASLARVWGFLKYHHPRVTAGEFHWDYELFRVMPDILAAPDRDTANTRLFSWLQSLGPIPAQTESSTPRLDVHLPADLAWLNDAALGQPLRRALEQVRHAHLRSGRQFFVSLVPSVRNPVFDHEPNYTGVNLPDPGFQLLALFRYWSIIHYWFPYRDLIEGDWNATLEAFIPRIGLAPTSDTYALELISLIATVHDTHANLWSSIHLRPPVGDSQLPIAVRFVEDQPVVTHVFPLAENRSNPFQHGDVILALDDKPVAELVREWRPYYAASNEPTRLRDIARFMSRGPAGPVTVRIRRDDATIEIEAQRVLTSSLPKPPLWHDLPGPAFRLLTPDVAYVKLSEIDPAMIEHYLSLAGPTKGWIVDLRNYPRNFVVFSLGTLFVERRTDFVRFTHASLNQPGAFVFTDCIALEPSRPQPLNRLRPFIPAINLDKSSFADRPDFPRPVPRRPEWTPSTGARYSGRLVVLVDEVTQSSAEYTAMALRASPRATVIGSTTAGADGNVSQFRYQEVFAPSSAASAFSTPTNAPPNASASCPTSK